MTLLIGIAGGTGSGKTTVAQRIQEYFRHARVVVLPQDAYYKDQSHLPMEERIKVNYDHPDAFDHDLLFSQMHDLLHGKSISHPVYDYKTHSRSSETQTVEPQPIIVLEGILILNDPRLRELMDIKIFVDTAPDICFIRRLKRDIAERGRSVDSVINQYMETVRPMYFQFIEPSKRHADLIIPRGGKNTVAIDVISTKIKDLLAKNKRN